MADALTGMAPTADVSIEMSVIDTLKSWVGAGGPCVQLDEPAAPGAAAAAVATLIASLRSSVVLKPRCAVTDDYFEAVLTDDHLPSCTDLLAGVLGEPAKPFGQRGRFEEPLRAMVDSHGGVDKDQCLYLRRFADDRVAFASLWPWSGGEQITLKVGVYADGLGAPKGCRR